MALLFHWAKPKSDELISAAYMQVAMQMGPGAGYPGGPAPPNFFNLPPGGGMYPSMDPSQAGTRAQRQDGSEAGLFVLLWPAVLIVLARQSQPVRVNVGLTRL